MSKLWSGRLRDKLDPAFEAWQASFAFDRRLLPDELAASAAYARALERARILMPAEAKAVLDGLHAIAQKADDPAFFDKPGIEDIHQFVEQELVALIGDTGYRLHAGRSRNEQIATDLRLYARRSLDAIRSALAELVSAFTDQADKAGDAPMPSYTHLQRAEPVLVGHWLMAYAEMFLRDGDRLADCRRRVNVLPLGSGAVAGPGVPLDRQAMAADLGFEAISANSMDVTSERDFELEFLQALSLVALHLSRWAEEFAFFSTAEYGFVLLPDAYSTGSSAMPQKKNPDALELLRGKAGRVIGAATALLVASKGLPLAYNKDMQEAQEPLFSTVDTIAGCLPVATGLMRAVAFDFDRMKKAAETGYLNATAAARYLVSRGVPFRLAHGAVGQAVRLALDKGCELQDLSLDELRQFRPEFDQAFYAAVELKAVLASQEVPGATAPARVREAIAAARRRLLSFRP